MIKNLLLISAVISFSMNAQELGWRQQVEVRQARQMKELQNAPTLKQGWEAYEACGDDTNKLNNFNNDAVQMLTAIIAEHNYINTVLPLEAVFEDKARKRSQTFRDSYKEWARTIREHCSDIKDSSSLYEERVDALDSLEESLFAYTSDQIITLTNLAKREMQRRLDSGKGDEIAIQ